VEIIVLMSNGVVFQNSSLSEDSKSSLGIAMVFLVVLLMGYALFIEFQTRLHARTQQKQGPNQTQSPPTSFGLTEVVLTSKEAPSTRNAF
jgi:Ca2+/H+ antiporter